MITRLITNDADTDKINTDSMVQLVSAIGVTNNMDGMYKCLLGNKIAIIVG